MWITYPSFWLRRRRMIREIRKSDPFIYEGNNDE